MATIKSIEQKAKAYDKALEKARQLCAYPTSKPFISDLQDLFPELAESEDEKIRKELIDFVKSRLAGFPDCKRFTDWLEKQGEHANFRNKIQVGDKITRNEDGVLVNLSQLKRVAKPAEEYNITGISSKNAQGKLGEMIKNLKQEELTEFEKAVKQVMEEAIECGDTHNLKADADLLLRLVQKPTWSEEDDTFFKAIIRDIENVQYISEYAKKDRINWLKSLKERYTWKPSDEQMQELHNVFNDTSAGWEDSVIESLYNDLLKLK